MTPPSLVGLVYNPQVAQTREMVDGLQTSLNLSGRSWISAAAEVGEMTEQLKDTSVVVVAGGDGTILRAVRVVASFEVPIIGINMGRIGFMSELTVDEVHDRLPEYLEGKFRVEKRMMLQVEVVSDSSLVPSVTLHALNDVVVGRRSAARLIDIDTTIDGTHLTSYRADAIIVSTATGSTGYALSAGGPILYPEAMVMLIQPVAAHQGLRDGLILPEESTIELTTTDGQRAMLSVDGFSDTELNADDRVLVRKSPYTARFVRAHPPGSFYYALTRRLGMVYQYIPQS